MEDFSANTAALRETMAEAVLCVSRPETIQAILENRVPKGNVFEMAKVAGLFAVKNTHQNLPNSYPVPIEFTSIEYSVDEMEIHILVKVKSVCNSDLEMEAMHGATVTALTIFGMLKPIDKCVSIRQVRVREQLNTSKNAEKKPFDVAVVLVSNSIVKGIKPESAGQEILEKLISNGGNITTYEVIPDEEEQIKFIAKRLAAENQLVIFSGGTGLSKTDVTTEALEPLLERRIPGIEEAMRSYGQKLTPYAMFSRSLAGMIGNCLVLALPGSTRGAKESMDAIFPGLLHALL